MCTPSDHLSPREAHVNEVIADYLEAVTAGHTPDRQDLLARHPDMAEELQTFFADEDRFARAAGDLAATPPFPGQGTTIALGPRQLPGPAPQSFSDYELLAEIARGGMGVVYKARQRRLNRIVALKMILAGRFASAADVERFRREAEHAANLDHPNIVPIYEVGEHEGQHYFSMKLIDGCSLADAMAHHSAQAGDASCRASSWSWEQRVQLLGRVARAVHHAHQRGLLHRDLKPANILLDQDGCPYVTDFGLAKRAAGGAGQTQSGAIVGTPSYMAPEQAAGSKDLTTAADVYALGAILYEMLTGQPPFRADTPYKTLLEVIRSEPPRPRVRRADIPRDLEIICVKCLEKDPARRYTSADELAEDLDRWLAGEPILARPVSARERLGKWVRRHPAWAAVVAVACLSIVGQLALDAVANARLQHERDEARKAWKNAAEERDAKNQALARAEGLRLTAQAEVLREANPGLALLLAVEGAERAPGLLANNALLAALDECRERRALLGHVGEVYSASFSADGERVLTCSADGSARVWDVETGRQHLVLREDDVPMVSAQFSPDGRRILTISAARYNPEGTTSSGSSSAALWKKDAPTARLWDAADGRLVARWQDAPREHYSMRSPFSVSFSPDSRLVATTFGIYPDGFPEVREAENGKRVCQFEGHRVPVVSVAFSPDSQRVVSASLDETACIWESATGKLVHTLKGHGCGVVHAAFSPDGKLVLTVGDGARHRFAPNSYSGGSGSSTAERSAARVWDAATGQELPDRALSWPELHRGQVHTAVFSRDGRRILTAGHAGSSQAEASHFLIWNAATGKPAVGFPAVHVQSSGGRQRESVAAAAFSPDARYVLSRSNDNTASLWEVSPPRPPGRAANAATPLSGKELLAFRGHTQKIWSAAFSPNGRRVVTASADGTARIWDAAILAPGSDALDDRWGHLSRTALSPDGRRLFVSHFATPGQGTPGGRLIDTATGRVETSLAPLSFFTAFSADSRRLFLAGYEMTRGNRPALTLDGESGHELARVPECRKRILAVSSDARLAVATSAEADRDDGTAEIWETGTGRSRARLVGHAAQMNTALFSPDGHQVLTRSADRTCRVWDTVSGKELFQPHPPAQRDAGADQNKEAPRLATFTPDGRRVLVLFSLDAVHARLFDSVTGQEVASLKAPPPRRSAGGVIRHYLRFATFSPDGRQVLMNAVNDDVGLWDATVGGEPLLVLRGHSSEVNSACFGPDGRLAVTTSQDRTARVWDVRSGELLHTLTGHEEEVTSAVFDPAGRLVATTSKDKTARVWEVGSGRELATLRWHEGAVTSAAFCADGQRVFTRDDRTARLWPVDILSAARQRLPRQLSDRERAQYEIDQGGSR